MSISSKATGLRPGVCTSTTRPTAPYTGQIIFETDTGYLRVWDGSAWDYLSQKQDDTVGLGPVGGLVYLASSTISGTTSYVEFANVFSSTYTNYRVEIANIHADAQGSLMIYFGTSLGSTGYYGSMYYDRSDGGLTGVVRGHNNGFIYLMLTDNQAGNKSSGSYDILNPQASTRTVVTGTYHGRVSYAGWSGGSNASDTSWVTCRFANDTGNLTGGSIRIYGYRNS